MKVVALQGDYHSTDCDVFPMLEQYCMVRAPGLRPPCLGCVRGLHVADRV